MQSLERILFLGAEARLIIGRDAVHELQLWRQTGSQSFEAGGIMIGRWISGSLDFTVDHVTRPHEKDTRRRTFFRRARKPALGVLREAWAVSNGTSLYVGEWHTHPEEHPTPSCLDVRNWKRLARKSKNIPPLIFFIIVGTSTIACWECRVDSKTVRKMKQADTEA